MFGLQETNIISANTVNDKSTEDVKFYDAFDVINNFFRYCGMYDAHRPKFSRGNGYQQYQRFVYIIGIANIVPLMLGEVTFLILSLISDEDRFLMIADMLPCLIMCGFGCAKTANLMIRRKKVWSLVEDLEKLWPTTDNPQVRQIIEENMKYTQKFFEFYMHFTVGLGMTYNFLPIFAIVYNCILDRFYNGNREWNENIAMPYVVWYPYDWKPLIIFIPTYLSQFFGGVFITSCVCSADCFFCLLVAQVCMHFQLLNREIKNLNNALNDQTKKEATSAINVDLKRIVEYHNLLYDLSDRIEHIFSVTLFFNFASSSLLICMEIFSVTIAPPALAFKYAMFFVSSVCQILLMCFYGDKLVEESEKVNNAAYDSNWPEGNSSLRHGVLMLMTRARKPAIISCMGFTTASLATFSSIMSASWSYFTLLHNMYQGAVEV